MFDNWFCYLKSLVLRRKSQRRTSARKVSRPSFRPRFDVLEDRMVPSGITVTSINSNGPGSLSLAVVQANSDTSGGPFTINFDPTAFATPQTITEAGTVAINNTTSGESIIIDGPAAALTIQGGGSSSDFSVFQVAPGTNATLENLTISNGNTNSVPGGGILYNGGGGAIFNSGTLTVSNCTLSNNNAFAYAGGIFNGGTLSVSNCTFSNNSAGSAYVGGAIYNQDTLTVSNSTFLGNSAGGAGGIATGMLSTLTVSNSTFSANVGGGIANGGTVMVRNSTFYNNSGAGIENDYASNPVTLTVNDCTLYGNSGGGINNYSGDAPTLTNTIVAGNTSSSNNGPDINGAVISTSANNLIGDGTGMSGISNGNGNHNQVGTSSSPIAPKLGPLQNNGGPTATMALQAGSPAIGNGEIVTDPTTGQPVTTDQQGYPRPSSNPDIGAYQTKTKAGTTTTVTSSSNPSVFGQSVTFTATVSSSLTGMTGTVTFQDGAISIGTGTVGGGKATLAASFTLVGTHTITAFYSGDSNFLSSDNTTVPFQQTVNQASTTTTVTSSVNPSVFGQSVTFTATVSSTTRMTGTVTFLDGSVTLGTGALSGLQPTTWSGVASMPTAREGLAAVEGPDGRIYAIGGLSSSFSVLNTVEAYTPGTNTWTTVASMPTARWDLAAVLGADGRIYAIGGYNSGQLNTVEAYKPGTNTWTTVASMPTAREGLAAVVGADGRIYAIGGINGGFHNTVEAYTPGTNTWTTVASMPTARTSLAAVEGADGRIYAIGGEISTGGIVNTVEAYTPGTNTWTTVASIPTAHCGLAGVEGLMAASMPSAESTSALSTRWRRTRREPTRGPRSPACPPPVKGWELQRELMAASMPSAEAAGALSTRWRPWRLAAWPRSRPAAWPWQAARTRSRRSTAAMPTRSAARLHPSCRPSAKPARRQR